MKLKPGIFSDSNKTKNIIILITKIRKKYVAVFANLSRFFHRFIRISDVHTLSFLKERTKIDTVSLTIEVPTDDSDGDGDEVYDWLVSNWITDPCNPDTDGDW